MRRAASRLGSQGTDLVGWRGGLCLPQVAATIPEFPHPYRQRWRCLAGARRVVASRAAPGLAAKPHACRPAHAVQDHQLVCEDGRQPHAPGGQGGGGQLAGPRRRSVPAGQRRCQGLAAALHAGEGPRVGGGWSGPRRVCLAVHPAAVRADSSAWAPRAGAPPAVSCRGSRHACSPKTCASLPASQPGATSGALL